MMDIFNRSRDLMPPRWRTQARSSRRHFLARDERGQAMVEMALILPLLMILVIGIITFGVVFWDQLTLTQAVTSAAQSASIMRADNPTDVCTPVNKVLAQGASVLKNSSIYGSHPLAFSMQVADSSGTSVTQLANSVPVAFSGGVAACNVQLAQGQTLTVSATYGCNLKMMGFNFAPNCVLSAQAAEAIQ